MFCFGVKNEKMVKIILTDENKICWKFYLTEDTRLVEILECIEHQFYPKIN